METNTLEIGLVINHMVKVFIYLLMVKDMKVKYKMDWSKGMVDTIMLMETNTKVTGLMIRRMVLVLCNIT